MNLWAIQFAWDPGMKMPETRRTWVHECVVGGLGCHTPVLLSD